MRDKVRWWLAGLLNRLPGQCWTDLVMFALRYRRSLWSPIGDGCRRDLAANSECYCGKLRAPNAPALRAERPCSFLEPGGCAGDCAGRDCIARQPESTQEQS